MAGGWARDGAVQDQIDDTVNDAVAAARARTPRGPSAEYCDDCGEAIPPRRRAALPGVRTSAAAARTVSCVDAPFGPRHRGSMSNTFIRAQHLVPQHVLSRLAGRFADSATPWLKDALIRRFIAVYNVDMAEAAEPAGAYPTFNAFFTRALKPGARPLADADTFVLSPADGAVSQAGPIAGGRIVQAKARDYSVAELLGGDPDNADRFDGGRFVTIYLAPKDYHRVHMPACGTLARTRYVPGDLFSVNGVTAAGVERLFARNERLASLFDGEMGRFASVMVGAMIVAGVETVWGGRVQPHGKAVLEQNYPDCPAFAAGDEMGRFYLGSTVVLLFEPGRVEWLDEVVPGATVRMGQAIGRRLQPGQPKAGE